MNALRGVARSHRRYGLPFPDLADVSKAAIEMTRAWVAVNGYRALLTVQAPPYLTEEVRQILSDVPEGAKLGRWSFRKGSRLGRSFQGVVALLAQAGFRGDEVALANGKKYSKSCLSRSNVYWRFTGSDAWVSSPTLEQLRSLRDGDLMMVIPPPSKADRFGTAWGTRPLYLRYSSSNPLSAARWIAEIELQDPCEGAERELTPLFTDDQGSMLQRSELAEAVRAALHVVGVAKERAEALTLHSFRRYLACALMGQKVPADTICALLRWRSAKSLLAYGQLQAGAYADLIDAAPSTDVDVVITAHLPIYEAEQVAAGVMQGHTQLQRLADRDGDAQHDEWDDTLEDE